MLQRQIVTTESASRKAKYTLNTMGLGTADKRMLRLIDIEKLMGSANMGLIDQVVN